MTDKSFYVYEHLSPQGDCFYVGKGKKSRYCDFKNNRNSGHIDVINAIISSGDKVIARKILRNMTNACSLTFERIMIFLREKEGCVLANRKKYDGRTIHYVSTESRAAMGRASKGNTYRKGSTHTKETREVLRVLGFKNKDIFAEYSHLGPMSMARPVICITDGRFFESASKAARFYGICKSSIIELCLKNPRRKSVGGRVFCYEDDE